MKNNTVVKDAEEYVFNLFRDKLPSDYVYHNFNHTSTTVKACKKLSKSYNMTSRDYEVLMLAAWFHDTGYINTYLGHEEESVKLMKAYLSGNYPDESINEIEALILSTKFQTVPDGSMQEILHDADYISLGSKNFNLRAELLQIEWERILDKTYTEDEWAQIQLKFLIDTSFKTEDAVLKYNEQRLENIIEQRNKIEEKQSRLLKEAEKAQAKPVKEGRGIETLYRSVYDYHINLTSIADNKANMMISINTIIMSIVITLFGT
ncbi:MAG: HD domain-containing protein, partial [Daejeonella sp.]|nr:HD domain-containing protein [Daejeonella sp.]